MKKEEKKINIDYNRVKKWLIKYKENEKQINNILGFLKNNYNVYHKYTIETTNKLICPCNNISEILYNIFLDSINASGGNNLTTTGESCESFWKIINKYESTINSSNRIDFISFANFFDKSISNINDYFKYLITYKNMKEKKASLFIKTLYYANEIKHIFENFNYSEFDYPIALDTVIEYFFNVMLGFKSEYIYGEDNSKNIPKWKKGKDIINSGKKNEFYNFDYFIESIGYNNEDKKYIESLWFWGYFNTNNKYAKEKNNTPEYKIIGFNEVKYYANTYFYPDGRFIKDLDNFNMKFKESFF
jgi:hypothetical protein